MFNLAIANNESTSNESQSSRDYPPTSCEFQNNFAVLEKYSRSAKLTMHHSQTEHLFETKRTIGAKALRVPWLCSLVHLVRTSLCAGGAGRRR
jgi:hypothetical protein